MAGKTVVEVHEMYGGKVKLEYLPNSHTYKVDGEKKIGVTTITGVINKEALMLWPLGEAMTYLKRKLLSGKDKDQATLWSDKELQALLEESAVAYQKKTLRGTDAGTMAHDWLESYIRWVMEGGDAPVKLEKVSVPKADEWDDERIRAEDLNNLVDAVDAFIHWVSDNDVEFLRVEDIIYSQKYDYAGRFDFIAKINGKVYMCDFKTSNPSREFQEGIYPENFAQVGGYDIAFTEEHPDFHIDGHAIFNLSKKSGKLKIKYSLDRQINKSFFLYALGTKRGMQHHTRLLSIKYQEKRKAK